MQKFRHFGKKTAKTQQFGKITAFDKNHGLRDFRDYLVSLAVSDVMSDVRCPMSVVRCPTHFCVCGRALSRSQFLTDFDEIWHRPLEPNSRHDPWKKFAKRAVVRVTWPLIFWALNANSSKMAKGANLKFGVHDPRQSPDMNHEKNWRKWGVFRSRDP